MSVLDPDRTHPQQAEDVDTDHPDANGSSPDEEETGHSGHSRWMMIACCIPMLAIAVALIAAGAGYGFLVIALACTAMMALMMGGMSRGDGDRR